MNFVSRHFYQELARWIGTFILRDDTARESHSGQGRLLDFVPCAELAADAKPDYIVLNGTLHHDEDAQGRLVELAGSLAPRARGIIIYYSQLWKPFLRLADWMGLRSKSPEINWLGHHDVRNLVEIAGMEVIRLDHRVLMPFPVPLLSRLMNRWLAPLPFFNWFCVANILVVRKTAEPLAEPPSVTIVVPARNEAGNVPLIPPRIPRMGPRDEIIFIEGGSSDATWDAIKALGDRDAEGRPILIAQQTGKGKGDAVRLGYSMARNEILMILDADMTVPPETLPRFHRVLAEGRAEFANGSRLLYPMEGEAMRFFNFLGNKFFATGFTFVLGQPYQDTLCGTKVMWRTDYEKLAARRWFFGDFDPFGDFDLILGASRMTLRVRDVPIHYKQRVYGDTNIQRWRHGWILLKMLWFAARRILFV